MSRCLAFIALLATTPAAADDDGWSPIDSRGWPRGVGLDELRDLPRCEPGELNVEEGGAISCRPAVMSDGPRVGMSVDWSSGPAFGSDRAAGGAHALGAEIDYAITRHLQLAARYELIGIAPTAMAGTESLNQHFFALAKLRLFNDEVARDAWTLGAGAGWALRSPSLGADAPIARLSIAREIGTFIGSSNAVGAAIELAYERTLDADALSALLVSYRMGFELNVREPRNLGRPAPRRSTWRTITGDAYIGNAIALGMSLGIRANRVLSLQTSGGFQFGTTEFTKQHGYDGGGWSVIAGPRVSLPLSQVAPYIQVQAGPVWLASMDGPDVRGLGHGELGMRLHTGCGGGVIDAAFWMRRDLDEGRMTSGGLLMRVGSGARSSGGCMHGTPTFATRPEPPREPEYIGEAPPELTEGETNESGSVAVEVPPPRATVEVAPPPVVVEVRPPPPVVVEVRPIVIEVELGVAVPGLQLRVDPRLLPIDRLRGVRHVSIELSGPSGALARFQAELSATLDRSGARVDAWSTVTTSSPRVRARITITP